ncbi:MAG: DUF6319 family protein [Pseudonocardia sediminis]
MREHVDEAQPGTPTTEPTGSGIGDTAPADGTTAAPTTGGTAEAGSPAEGTPSATTSPEQAAAEAPEKPKRGRPKGSSTAKTTRVVSLTLTVSGSADGEWQAELKTGATWVARGLPVTAAAVSQAAAALHADLAGPIDEVIETARSAKAARVAELEAELEQAKKALAEME